LIWIINSMTHAFVRYAAEDRDAALPIIEALRQSGSDVEFGEIGGEAEQLDTATCVVVLWSKATAQSIYVLDEIQQAIKAWSSGRLVLASLDDTPLPVGLRDLSAIPIGDRSDSGTKQLTERVAASIEGEAKQRIADLAREKNGLTDALGRRNLPEKPVRARSFTNGLIIGVLLLGGAILVSNLVPEVFQRSDEQAELAELRKIKADSETKRTEDAERQQLNAKAASAKAEEADAETKLAAAAEASRAESQRLAPIRTAARDAAMAYEQREQQLADIKHDARKYFGERSKVPEELKQLEEEAQSFRKAHADAQAKLKAAEPELQRLNEEVQRHRKAAADAEANRRAAEVELGRLQRQAKAAADAEAKHRAAEVEQQRLDKLRMTALFGLTMLLLGAAFGAGAVFAWTAWSNRRRTASAVAFGSLPQPGAHQSPIGLSGGQQVFISYSRQDARTVEHLVKQIEQLGCVVWIDRELYGSQRFAGPIVQAIRKSRLVALMCSRHAYTSDNVIREINVAGECKKPFILFELDLTELPDGVLYFVSGFPRVSVTTLDEQQLQSEITRLVSV
jgi:hypothetical protein